jgi:DNA polymerase
MPAAPRGIGDAPQATAPAAPAAPARMPGTPSIASTGEDMSWFDDAPTPEFKPQRKKVAAPEQPGAAQPPRPVPAAPAARPTLAAAQQARAASAPPAAMPGDAPAFDDIPMDEPPSWFDDDQTAAPTSHTAAPAGEAIARMDWPALQAAVASCTRCGRCETRRQAIPGRGDQQASWIALDSTPGAAEDAEGYLFAGDPGYLLDNMLKAVGQTTDKGAYLTSLVKCHAPHAPTPEELQACRPYLQRELELTQAKVIVAFGHGTGKGLLGAAARGRIMMHGSVPVVATYHPADLLKKPEEKAKAWQDLCLAKAAHAGRR